MERRSSFKPFGSQRPTWSRQEFCQLPHRPEAEEDEAQTAAAPDLGAAEYELHRRGRSDVGGGWSRKEADSGQYEATALYFDGLSEKAKVGLSSAQVGRLARDV